MLIDFPISSSLDWLFFIIEFFGISIGGVWGSFYFFYGDSSFCGLVLFEVAHQGFFPPEI